jgi:DNA polymerase-3 subunit delta'
LQAANAFLKTLEEPPADSILVLLSTESQRMLETILSRCLRLNFAGEAGPHRQAGFLSWLTRFSAMAATEQRSLLGRYRLLSILLEKLNQLRTEVTETLTKRSPLERFEDADPKLREKWEDELTAAIEAEYRRQRGDVLSGLEWWLRDIWLNTMHLGGAKLMYPELAGASGTVAQRISSQQAIENLRQVEQTQRLLASNVQEALALEVGLLRLSL